MPNLCGINDLFHVFSISATEGKWLLTVYQEYHYVKREYR